MKIEKPFVILKHGIPYVPRYVNTPMREVFATADKKSALDWCKSHGADIFTVAELVPCS